MASLHLANEIFKLIYPVGSIYMSWNSTDPSTLFGGTWTRLKGGFIYGCVSNSNTGNGTGTTTNNHTLTISEMPSHTHAQNVTANPGSGGRGIRQDWDGDHTGLSIYAQGCDTNGAGGGQGHSHNIPYIAVFVWKRTG